MPKFAFGCRPDKKDQRDHLFSVSYSSLPAAVDLRAKCPPVMDQGQLGSCTAHGITGALRFLAIAAGKTDVALARLQLYYDERALEHTVTSDAGAEIRDGVKSAAKLGVAPEGLWPYLIGKFAIKPTPAVYKAALADRALTYERVAVSTTALKAALAAGHPVVIGISVYDSFEAESTIRTGIVPMPAPDEAVVGGHCMYVVGYDDSASHFIVRNSWGVGVGDKGDFYIPYAYLGSPTYGSDYWVIRQLAA